MDQPPVTHLRSLGKRRTIHLTTLDTFEFKLALMNGDAPFEMVNSLMSKGMSGTRDLRKRLWKLPKAWGVGGEPIFDGKAFWSAGGGSSLRKDTKKRRLRYQELIQ